MFAAVFGKAWSSMPAVMHKHYANRAYSHDITTVQGTLDVMCRPPLRWLAPLLTLLGQIPPKNEEQVPVAVEFRSEPDTNAFHLIRQFKFRDGDYQFHSRMFPASKDEVIEVMPYGLCWRMRYAWHDEKVTLNHIGYALRILGKLIPIPLTWILGSGYAEETAIDERTFRMSTHITHPLWGKIYQYSGQFTVIEKV